MKRMHVTVCSRSHRARLAHYRRIARLVVTSQVSQQDAVRKRLPIMGLFHLIVHTHVTISDNHKAICSQPLPNTQTESSHLFAPTHSSPFRLGMYVSQQFNTYNSALLDTAQTL